MSTLLPQTAAKSYCAQSFFAEVFRGSSNGFVNVCRMDEQYHLRSFSIPLAEAVSVDWTGILSDLKAEHVYFQVTPIGIEPDEKKRGKASDAITMTGFMADIDFAHPDKTTTALPKDADEAFALFSGEDAFLAPSLIVRTGRGLHAYWLFDEPFDMKIAEAHQAATHLNKAFGQALRDNALKRFGWKFDAVSDLARLGRVPGSLNIKENPAPMVSWSFYGQGQRYAITDVIDDLERRGVNIVGPTRRRKCDTLAATAQTSSPWAAIYKTEREWLAAHCEARAKVKIKKLVAEENKPENDKAPPEREPSLLLPNAAAMAVGCGWMKNIVDDPTTVPYADWFASINLLSKCDNGHVLAHAVSAPHAKYTSKETNEKLAEVAGIGPISCRHVENDLGSSACKACPFKAAVQPIKSPLDLGQRRRSSHYVNLLKRTAFVVADGQFIDCEDTDADLARDGLSKDAFRDRHAHPPVSLPSADYVIADGLLQKADIRRFDPRNPRGVSKSDGQRIFNEYAPPAVSPREGDVSAFLALIDRVFADHAGHALSYLAHLRQKPWEKITHGILIQSGQGLGKGSLFKVISQVLGASNCQTVDNNVFDDGYWARMSKRVLLLINEVQAEDKIGVYNALKSVMADEDFDAKEKWVKNRRLMAPRGVLVFSNKPVPMKIESDDRRFYVLRRFDVAPAPDGFFAPFFNPSEEMLSAVSHFLNSYDISNFDPKSTPPMTDAKRALIDGSKTRLEQLIGDAVEAQDGPFRFPIVGNRWIEGWLNERLSSWARPALRETLQSLNVVPLKDTGQQRCSNLGVYGGPQRFWVVRDHADWIDRTSTEVRDAYVKLCLKHGEPKGRELVEQAAAPPSARGW